MSEKVKVLFLQDIGNGKFETESLWCLKSGQYFIIDNIPFTAKRIALGDIIKADYDEEDGAYYFDDFIEVSGNSTIRIYFILPNIIQKTRAELIDLGCESEAFLQRNMAAVNIPKLVDYRPVREFLEKGEAEKLWSYEESCLCHEY